MQGEAERALRPARFHRESRSRVLERAGAPDVDVRALAYANAGSSREPDPQDDRHYTIATAFCAVTTPPAGRLRRGGAPSGNLVLDFAVAARIDPLPEKRMVCVQSDHPGHRSRTFS
jgi:hypothetical protein